MQNRKGQEKEGITERQSQEDRCEGTDPYLERHNYSNHLMLRDPETKQQQNLKHISLYVALIKFL